MTAQVVSVIVSTYNDSRWDCLVRSLTALRYQTIAPLEVIVVVDHNTPLLHRVRDELPHAVAIESHDPPGLATARNSGLVVARGDVVAFIDDDAEAYPDWLERLLQGYFDENVVGVGGAIEPKWQTSRPNWLPGELDWVVGCSYVGLPTTARPVRNLIGCNMSFRREWALRIGGFRTGFGRTGAVPMGCEETEFCIRLRQRWPNQVLMYEPRARVAHHVPVERGHWRYVARRCLSEGLSKAQVTAVVGNRDGLSKEREYVMRTLPIAFARGLTDFALRGRTAGLRRSATVACGLLLTIAGYCHGRLHRLPRVRQQRATREMSSLAGLEARLGDSKARPATAGRYVSSSAARKRLDRHMRRSD